MCYGARETCRDCPLPCRYQGVSRHHLAIGRTFSPSPTDAPAIAKPSRHGRHRRLLLHVFVMRGSENSCGELVGCWLPFNTLFEIDHMNLGTTASKPRRGM